jgi:hypothetical protein
MADQTKEGSSVNTALHDPNVTYEVDVGNDFTRYPAGRDLNDGPYCGQVFREKFLEPRLGKHEKVIVKLDGALDYGSSFLEEAFGGLIRLGYPKADVLALVEFQSEDPILKQEILGYIDSAKPPA